MRVSLLLALLFFPSLASARISRTYVCYAVNYTLMLQLTETNNGQISGVVSWLELQNNGQTKSGQELNWKVGTYRPTRLAGDY